MKAVEKISICFLILHYMNAESTCKTLESVLTLHNLGDAQIVVVDNASPNGSGRMLKEKYKDFSQIHIIFSTSNLGFSAGNNLGFHYIKKKFAVDFVVAINNDILFPQKDFINKLKILYAESPFWVAGPDIYMPRKNYHSSPVRKQPYNEWEMEQLIRKWEFEKRIFKRWFSIYGFRGYIRDSFADNIIIKLIAGTKRFLQGQDKNYKERSQDVVLQGACLIFDKRYCEKNSDLFPPLTFMYVEEDILSLYCKKYNWKIRYFPELQIWHLHEESSQLLKVGYQKYCDKRIVKLDRLLEAGRIYLEQLDVF